MSLCSHLLSIDELQRTQRSLEIGGAGLQVVESRGNLRLQLGGVLAGWAVGRDLVEGGGRHLDCLIPRKELTRIEVQSLMVGKWMIVIGAVAAQDCKNPEKFADLSDRTVG